MKVIAVIGSKKSGKTTTVEALIRGLTKRGYQVATVKHVSEIGFTLDTEGKDTWRHAQAGAKTMVVVAPSELGIIKKVVPKKQSLQEIIHYCQNNVDFVILEGFRSLVEKESAVPKIVAVKAYYEAVETLNRFKPIIAFTGPAASAAKELGIPIVDILEEPHMLFVYIGYTSTLIMGVCFSISMYMNNEFPKQYTYIIMLFTIVHLTISIMGLIGLASNRTLYVTAQKIGWITSLICFVILGYGCWKLEKA